MMHVLQGGTLTMSNDPTKGNSLAPVQGALTSYMAKMSELTDDPEMPEVISHEYKPLIDSSDMGPVSLRVYALWGGIAYADSQDLTSCIDIE